MKQNPYELSPAEVTSATDRSRRYAEEAVVQALRLAADADLNTREAQGLCKACYYLRAERIGGAAITTRPCGVCLQEMTFGSTATDKLCGPCAVRECLCKQCGGDLKLRARRVWQRP